MGAWGIQPSEFWKMTPSEWWRLYEMKRPHNPETDYAGTLTESAVADMYRRATSG